MCANQIIAHIPCFIRNIVNVNCDPHQSVPIFNSIQLDSCMRGCVCVCVSVFIGFFNSIYYYFTRKLLILHNSVWNTPSPLLHCLLKNSFDFFFSLSIICITIEEVKGHVALFYIENILLLFFFRLYIFHFNLNTAWFDKLMVQLDMLFHCYFPLKFHLPFSFFSFYFFFGAPFIQ